MFTLAPPRPFAIGAGKAFSCKTPSNPYTNTLNISNPRAADPNSSAGASLPWARLKITQPESSIATSQT
jgi:hypothetical protein